MSTNTKNVAHFKKSNDVAQMLYRLNTNFRQEGDDEGLIFDAIDQVMAGQRTDRIEKKVIELLRQVLKGNADLIPLSQTREDALDADVGAEFVITRCINFLLKSKSRNWSEGFVSNLGQLRNAFQEQRKAAIEKSKQLPSEQM